MHPPKDERTPVVKTRWPALALLLAATPALAAGQEPPLPMEPPAPRVTLTLADALAQARQNSPAYRSSLNDAAVADWGVRGAYGSFLPHLSVNSGMGYTGSGASAFGGTTFNQRSPALSSSYGINLSMQVDGSTLAQTSQERANRDAVHADIERAGIDLRTEITAQYLTTLQAVAETGVARQQVRRNGDFLALARARHQAGQATLLEVRQAEVQRGQAEVALLRAAQAENEAKLALFRLMGIRAPVPVQEVALVDEFPVVEPAWALEPLVRMAGEENPGLLALRAREHAAGAAVRASRSGYFPSLSVQAGWRGFTQQFTNTDILLGNRLGGAKSSALTCRFQNDIILGLPAGRLPNQPNGGLIDDCNSYAGLDATGEALDPAVRQGILDANRVFPWDFRRQPFSAALTVSLPIFNGFSRELRVAQSRAQQEDAREAVRARELLVGTEVESRWLQVQTAYRSIGVQAANREAAREQLALAQERYRVGVGNSLEVSDAQTAVQRAEGDYVTAVYSYHRAVAALEAAVGRTLR
jgi:outer membrane protein